MAASWYKNRRQANRQAMNKIKSKTTRAYILFFARASQHKCSHQVKIIFNLSSKDYWNASLAKQQRNGIFSTGFLFANIHLTRMNASECFFRVSKRIRATQLIVGRQPRVENENKISEPTQKVTTFNWKIKLHINNKTNENNVDHKWEKEMKKEKHKETISLNKNQV